MNKTQEQRPCPLLTRENKKQPLFSLVPSVQLSHVWLFVTPWTAARHASLSITNCQSLLKLMSIASVMPSKHLITWCLLLPLPSIFPSIRVFSNELVLHIRWPKYWSFSFSISPSNEYSEMISFRKSYMSIYHEYIVVQYSYSLIFLQLYFFENFHHWN